MDRETENIILATVGTFRMGAPIIIDDIRFAAKVDGHPLDHVSSKELVWVLKKHCDMETLNSHDRASWFRREDGSIHS